MLLGAQKLQENMTAGANIIMYGLFAVIYDAQLIRE
jgi:hypothetical protein